MYRYLLTRIAIALTTVAKEEGRSLYVYDQSILVKIYTGQMCSLVKYLRFAFIKTNVCGRTSMFSAHC